MYLHYFENESKGRCRKPNAICEHDRFRATFGYLPLALLLRVWCLTLRFHASDESRQVMKDAANPTVFLLWHNRLFVAADIYRRYRTGHPCMRWLVRPRMERG